MEVNRMTHNIAILLFSIICPTWCEILTQSFIIRLKEMEELIQEQKQANKDMTQIVEQQGKLIDTLTSGVHFSAKMSQEMTFLNGQIITFDQTLINTGDGYIDDNGNADYGKFIAPRNGTYKLSVNVFNHDKSVGADMLKNGVYILTASNGLNGLGSISIVLDLTEGDKIYLVRPNWVADDTEYSQYVCSFSGFFILGRV